MKKMNKDQLEEVIFASVLFVISLMFTLQAFTFKRQAAILPLAISIPLTILTAILLLRMLKTDFFETEQGKKKHDGPSLKDEAIMWLWVFGLLAGVIVVGIVPAGSVFIFLYLIFITGFKWLKSLIFTVVTMGAIYTMFTVLLRISLFKGILFG